MYAGSRGLAVRYLIPCGMVLWILSGHGAVGEEPRAKLKGHDENIYALEFSPDSKILASCSSDATIRLWDVTAGKELRKLTGHEGQVSALAFSPDGSLLASGGIGKPILVWDVQSGSLKSKIDAHDDGIWALAFSPDGATLASGGDKVIKLWDAKTLKLKKTLTDVNTVTCLAYLPDGKTIVSGGLEKPVLFWDIESGKLAHTSQGHEDNVLSVAVSPDGKTVASSSSDKTARLWSPATGAAGTVLKGHEYGVRTVAFSPNGQFVVSAADDDTVRFWNLAGKELFRFKPHQHRSKRAAWSPDGKTIATAGETLIDMEIKLWDLPAAVPQSALESSKATAKPGEHHTAVPLAPAVERLWTDRNGKTLRAILIEVKDGKVTLQKSDGKTISIPLERFSDADQPFLKQ